MSSSKSKSRAKKPKTFNKYVAIISFLLLSLLLASAIIVLQSNKINSLRNNQLPKNLYSNFENCMSDGGKILNTINGSFDACLGGNLDPLNEIPQHQAFLQYSAQNLPRINERRTQANENKVSSSDENSPDLVEFLKFNKTGCQPRGEYKIVKEIKDRFALVRYGCDGDGQVRSSDSPRIIAIKLGDGWSLISPTNHMNDDTPSCLLVDMFKISKDLSDKCFENTGFNNGSLRDVRYL